MRLLLPTLAALALATPAVAQTAPDTTPSPNATPAATQASPPTMGGETAPPKAITVSGSLAILTDYRLRGVSQTDKNLTVQGSITIAHQSGFYIGTFGANLAGWGTFGGANLELDAIGGWKHSFGPSTVDAGVTFYTYPGGYDDTTVAELFGRLSGTRGPATLTAGAYYAPNQRSLGRIYRNAAEYAAGVGTGSKNWDNLYLTGDAAVGIPRTPVTAKAHIGYSKGNPGLGPNGTSLAPTGSYWDWMLGADVAAYRNLTVNVSYIDTDISNRRSAYLAPNFRTTTDGKSISGGTVVASVTAAF